MKKKTIVQNFNYITFSHNGNDIRNICEMKKIRIPQIDFILISHLILLDLSQFEKTTF